MDIQLWPRRDLLLGLAATGAPLSLPASARAQEPATPASPPEEVTLTVEELVTLDTVDDDAQRLRVPVMVDGRGPFPFLVDTGADHSVLSQELARALKLPAAGFVRVNGIAGTTVAPRAAVRRLEVGGAWESGRRRPTGPSAGRSSSSRPSFQSSATNFFPS